MPTTRFGLPVTCLTTHEHGHDYDYPPADGVESRLTLINLPHLLHDCDLCPKCVICCASCCQAVSQASDRARSILPLSALARIQGNVEGLHSWELPGKEGEMGYQETDGPAYLVTRPDIQVGGIVASELTRRNVLPKCVGCVCAFFLLVFLTLRLRSFAWGVIFSGSNAFSGCFPGGEFV